jgi:hypothetical protein
VREVTEANVNYVTKTSGGFLVDLEAIRASAVELSLALLALVLWLAS